MTVSIDDRRRIDFKTTDGTMYSLKSEPGRYPAGTRVQVAGPLGLTGEHLCDDGRKAWVHLTSINYTARFGVGDCIRTALDELTVVGAG